MICNVAARCFRGVGGGLARRSLADALAVCCSRPKVN